MRAKPERSDAAGDAASEGSVKWVTVKVRPRTKRLLDLIAAAEMRPMAEIVEELARGKWDRVKESDILP